MKQILGSDCLDILDGRLREARLYLSLVFYVFDVLVFMKSLIHYLRSFSVLNIFS